MQLRDITSADVKTTIDKHMSKDGAGSLDAAHALTELWWPSAMPGVHNPPAKDDLQSMILDCLLGSVPEAEVGEVGSEWWSYVDGCFNPVTDIDAKDALAILLVTACKASQS